ncbi:general transcription factor IIF subunit 1-like [Mytilus galloprovincialis]|uniref:Transcription initiation factor IIF subunit alpha n=1 Tax=Mytilus galloprovincialis TaxID=29158 RepID=A0A8B6BFB4_MYTGA|nr:transcription initiation factor TFIIF subunit alpha [Mytilus galloprovincialis]
MATPISQPQVAAASGSATQEHSVRVLKDHRKIYKMMKFSSGNELDFVKLSETPVRMERENNFKEYKTANDIGQMPKFGAGSEFGREQKEIARKKKYGIMMKNYNPSDQPWLLKIGKNKETKRYKGVREGTITENTSYYIFTQCSDGAFEAFPVEEWYNFSPMIRYKYLNSEEAEEEFSRRDKTLNYFSIMVRKRCRNDEDLDKVDEEEKNLKVKTSKKSSKDLVLTDIDEWFDISDDEDDDDDNDEEDGDEDSKKKKKGKKLAKKIKKKRTAKHNSDDEAIEESDEGDYDDKEVDYISDSGSSSEEEGTKKDKYEEKGVDEEKGLRKLIGSDEEESEEEEKKEEENKEKEEKAKKGDEDESSSSSSGEDSDIEKDEGLASAIFLQQEAKRNSPVPRSDTPSSMETEDKKSMKRKLEGEASSSKKMRTDSPSVGGSKEGITESAIRRYLIRKPMTPKELVQKFKSKKLNISKEQMTSTIAQLLKKINPDKKIINKAMYLSLKSS